jgi:hypothetical protein
MIAVRRRIRVMNTPAKKFAKGSWSASATARPPTPRAVSMGVMDKPKPFRITSSPIVTTRPHVILRVRLLIGRAGAITAPYSSMN